MELPAELADIGDPQRQHPRVADVDLARRQIRERLVRQVGRSSAGRGVARTGPWTVISVVPDGDVGDRHELAVRDVPLDPRRHPPVDEVRDDERKRSSQPGDGQVGDDPARLVSHCV